MSLFLQYTYVTSRPDVPTTCKEIHIFMLSTMDYISYSQFVFDRYIRMKNIGGKMFTVYCALFCSFFLTFPHDQTNYIVLVSILTLNIV